MPPRRPDSRPFLDEWLSAPSLFSYGFLPPEPVFFILDSRTECSFLRFRGAIGQAVAFHPVAIKKVLPFLRLIALKNIHHQRHRRCAQLPLRLLHMGQHMIARLLGLKSKLTMLMSWGTRRPIFRAAGSHADPVFRAVNRGDFRMPQQMLCNNVNINFMAFRPFLVHALSLGIFP